MCGPGSPNHPSLQPHFFPLWVVCSVRGRLQGTGSLLSLYLLIGWGRGQQMCPLGGVVSGLRASAQSLLWLLQWVVPAIS